MRCSRFVLVGLISLVTVVGHGTADGGGATAAEAPIAGDAPSVATEPILADTGYEDVFAAIEGLEGQARIDELVRLATESDQPIMVYSGTFMEPILEAFEAKYGLDAELYNAASEEIITRLTQEAGAGRVAADIVDINGAEMEFLARAGILVPYESVYVDELIPEAIQHGWTATHLTTYVTVRNTNNVDESEAPTSWEDLADPKWEGRIMMEAGSVDWFYGLWNYFTEDQGMTDDEAREIFEGIAANSVVQQGHLAGLQLLTNGERDLFAATYAYSTQRAIDQDGAPLAWEPANQPIIARPTGTGVVANAPNPAGALLYHEFLLSPETQQLVGPNFLNNVTNEALIPADAYELHVVDIPDLVDHYDEFSDLYDEILANAGH